jgi:type II secretory pathway pseudopilin PulG
MMALLCFVLTVLASPFKSNSRLEAENAALRHQLIVLRRKVQSRVRLTNNDRLFFVQLYRWFPSVLKAITIIRPETIVRWQRAGFPRYWRARTDVSSRMAAKGTQGQKRTRESARTVISVTALDL